MIILMKISGFLFLFILVLQIAMAAFGYILEPTPKHYESDAKLQKFNKDPKKFKIGVGIALVEHFCVITLAIMLFFVIAPYILLFGIVLIMFRVVEALIQIYDKKNYWGLLNIAKQYSDTSGAEKDVLTDLGSSILKTKEFRFVIAQLFFSIGTLAYSILFVTYGVVPTIIGWFGIVASILYGFGNGIFLIKPNFKVLWNIGGLLIFLFEVVLGGWLLIFSHLIP